MSCMSWFENPRGILHGDWVRCVWGVGVGVGSIVTIIIIMLLCCRRMKGGENASGEGQVTDGCDGLIDLHDNM